MDFAKRQLEKYGWKNGKGLGKHENGISQALKPKLKRSVAGVGHDAASDFTEHWWTTLYNKAAQNVEVVQKNGKTKKIKTKDTSDFEITNSTWKLKRKKNESNPERQYGDFFIKKAVLDGSKTEKVSDSDSDSDEGESEKKDVSKLTDEELFAVCGGRTAHKGARHGLKALGKLARIEMQEKLLLEQQKSKFEGYSVNKTKTHKFEDIPASDEKIVEDANLSSKADVKTKKKKKKKRCFSNNIDNNELLNETEVIDKSIETVNNDILDIKESINGTEVVDKSIEQESNDIKENITEVNNAVVKTSKNKKSKKSKKRKLDNDSIINDNKVNNDSNSDSDAQEIELDEIIDFIEGSCNTKSGKKKKKRSMRSIR